MADQDLFGPLFNEQDIHEVLSSNKASKEFRIWFTEISTRQPEEARKLLRLVIKKVSSVKTALDALLYLRDLSRGWRLERIALEDLKAEHRTSSVVSKMILQVDDDHNSSTAGHPRLAILSKIGTVAHSILTQVLFQEPTAQLQLFADPNMKRIGMQLGLALFDDDMILKQDHMRFIDLPDVSRELWRIFKKSPSWQERVFKARHHMKELEHIFLPFLPSRDWQKLSKLRSSDLAEYMYLVFLSEIAGATVHYQKVFSRMGENHFLLGNVPVVPAGSPVGLGRMDLFDIRSTRAFSKRQRQELERLRAARLSVKDLLYIIRSLIGNKKLHVGVEDWKFQFGQELQAAELQYPFVVSPSSAHKRQVLQYLAGMHVILQDLLPDATGSLLYLSPGGVDIHPLGFTREEIEQASGEMIVGRVDTAKTHAVIRGLTSHFSRHLRDIKKPRQSKRSPSDHQGDLFDLPQLDFTLEILAFQPRFAYQHDLIEEVPVNGSKKLVLHYNRLLPLIGTRVKVDPDFSDALGGKIECLDLLCIWSHPGIHMHVSVDQKKFYCEECGLSGEVNAIPPRLRISAAVRALRTGETAKAKKLVIVPNARKREVLTLAQDVFHRNFMNASAAQEYLTQKRGISVGLAYEYGAGFAEGRLILELLHKGVSWVELYECGLVAYTSWPSRFQDVLMSGGYKLPDLKRELEVALMQEVRASHPSFPMKNRITFPLYYGGKIANIYGRRLDKRGKKHRVLKRPFSHAGFNTHQLTSKKQSQVYITESVYDALSLDMFGMVGLKVASAGGYNKYLLDEVARSGKQVKIAFNFDKVGRQNAERAITYLTRLGVDVENFFAYTQDCFPDFKGATDYNDLLLTGENLLPF